MNYKKFIPSRKLRILMLSLLSWIPNRVMVSLQYRIHTGRKLNLKNPQRFTEKLQIYKLKYRNPIMLQCTDKYTVRKYVAEKGLANILIPLIGIYNSPCEIDFDTLPNQFVAKTNDGGGGNQVFICRDKISIDKQIFIKTLSDWMSQPKPKKHAGREWAYENCQPRKIIIEQLISDEKYHDIPDFKFYCFNGEPHYCQVIMNRYDNETIDFFDMKWHHQPFYGLNPKHGPAPKPAPKPAHFDTMKNIAKQLSYGFPFSRIDLYSTKSNVWFGEITFYPASGYGNFTPDEWDFYLGNLFNL